MFAVFSLIISLVQFFSHKGLNISVLVMQRFVYFRLQHNKTRYLCLTAQMQVFINITQFRNRTFTMYCSITLNLDRVSTPALTKRHLSLSSIINGCISFVPTEACLTVRPYIHKCQGNTNFSPWFKCYATSVFQTGLMFNGQHLPCLKKHSVYFTPWTGIQYELFGTVMGST